VKEATDRATLLAQKIVDARTSLMLLRQRHPHPRLTIALADEKLADQVTEMQKLNDEVQAAKQKNKAEKTRMKTTTTDLENIGIEAAEAAKQAEMAHVEEDDSRIIPLYDW
jgi:ribosomal protein L18